MPRLRKTPTPEQPPRAALVASAALVSKSQTKTAATTQPWQTEGWDYYDKVSELRYAATWVGNALSRVRLYAAKPDPTGQGDPIPLEPDHPAQAPLQALFGGTSAHPEAMRRLGILFDIPGEAYIIATPDPERPDMQDPDGRRWFIFSSEEMSKGNNDLLLVRRPEDDSQLEIDPDNADTMVLRIWRPHPRRSYLPDSPVRALLPALKELVGASAHIEATLESRLAGAGILFMPESASTPAPGASEGANPIHDDPFMAAFIEAMTVPLQDRESASAVVPIVARIPDEATSKPQFMSFATELDARAIEIRDNNIRRVAAGTDVPPEVVLGMGDVNHWSAWAIEESSVKLHIAPRCASLCDPLTRHYYRPILRELGIADAEDLLIWFDTTPLTARPNQGQDALTLWQQGLLGGDAVRREFGFGDDEAPDPEEWQRILAQQIAQTNAQLAPTLLAWLGLNVPGLGAAAATDNQSEVGVGNKDRALHPEVPTADRRELPAAPTTTPTGEPAAPALAAAASRVPDAWRLVAAELTVMRALTRAGNWLLASQGRGAKQRFAAYPAHTLHTLLPVPEPQLDKMLSGAYTELSAVSDDVCLQGFVDSYVRRLLVSGRPHSRQVFAALLSSYECPEQIGAAA